MTKMTIKDHCSRRLALGIEDGQVWLLAPQWPVDVLPEKREEKKVADRRAACRLEDMIDAPQPLAPAAAAEESRPFRH